MPPDGGIIQDRSMSDVALTGYEYSLSGLSGVILEGGVTRHATAYGEGTAITGHPRAARRSRPWIVAQQRFVTGAEHRFLRTLIGLSPGYMKGETGGLEAAAVVAAEAERDSLLVPTHSSGDPPSPGAWSAIARGSPSPECGRIPPARRSWRASRGATGWTLADAR